MKGHQVIGLGAYSIVTRPKAVGIQEPKRNYPIGVELVENKSRDKKEDDASIHSDPAIRMVLLLEFTVRHVHG